MKKNFIAAFMCTLIIGLSTALFAATFSGDWETNWGPLHLSQNGNTVTGNYEGDYPGTMTGTIKGNRLSFNWEGSNGEKGKGYFILSEDGNSIAGSWGSENSDSNGGEWTGERSE